MDEIMELLQQVALLFYFLRMLVAFSSISRWAENIHVESSCSLLELKVPGTGAVGKD